MESITIRRALKEEIHWVNHRYREVNFVPSDYESAMTVIALFNNEKAGLGRLVNIDANHLELGGIYVFPEFRNLGIAKEIVSGLLAENTCKTGVIWCLPFHNLQTFYESFGFSNFHSSPVPQKISEKLAWCNSNQTYEKPVILLSLQV